jgi:hypothetical protein
MIPQGQHGGSLVSNLRRIDPRLFVVQAQTMLQTTEVAIGLLRGTRQRTGKQPQIGGNAKLTNITQIVSNCLMRMRMTQHQILDGEFDIGQAAGVGIMGIMRDRLRLSTNFSTFRNP